MLAKTAGRRPPPPALEVIEQEVERMAELVANLLQFSRRGRGPGLHGGRAARR